MSGIVHCPRCGHHINIPSNGIAGYCPICDKEVPDMEKRTIRVKPSCFAPEQEVIKAMRAYAKTIAREAFQNEVEECVADTAKVWARRLYESRYTEPMTDKLVKAEVQSYIKEQMSHKEMLDLIQGTVQAAVAECKDKTKQFAQTEVEKYLKGAVVMNAIHEEIKRVVPQAVLDALRGV